MNKRVIALVAFISVVAIMLIQLKPWVDDEAEGELTLYGNVDIREVHLGFRVAGRLQQMNLEEGDAVTANTLLATLDDEPFIEALAVDNARVEEAQAQLLKLKNGSRPQEIEAAKANVAEVKSVLQRAQQDLKRQRQLMSEDVGSQRQLDAAIAMEAQAHARLNSSQENLNLAIEGARQEDITAAQAALTTALAMRDQNQTRLEDTKLFAPNAGVIMTRVREPGAMLGISEPVYVLSLTETTYVRAYVDENRLGQVVPGTSVTITTDSSERTFQGQIGFVSPRAEFTPKTVETPELRTDLVYRLRIVVKDANNSLRQGMPVTVKISTAKS